MQSPYRPALEFYAITDQASSKGRADLEIATALLDGGATVLQYRAKKVSARVQYKTALALRILCNKKKIPFVVNDRIDLALAVKADGVHLGQDDLPLEIAKQQAQALGQTLFVGKSTHTLQQAVDAQREGADYIGFGPVYATQTKEHNVPPVGLAALAQVLDRVDIPVVAIGGIKPNHLQELARIHTAHIAVVTYLTGAEKVAQRTRETTEQWEMLREKISHPSIPIPR